MTTVDTPRQRALFEAWLDAHAPHSALVALAHASFSRSAVLARVTSLAGLQGSAEYVYLLVEDRAGEAVPAYIGKAKDPLKRWAQHLTSLAKGTASYARWRKRLLREGHEEPRFDLTLFVVGEDQILFPPLPDFPRTIGSVEYQLVSLASHAYPLPLLNVEGQAR